MNITGKTDFQKMNKDLDIYGITIEDLTSMTSQYQKKRK